MAAAALVALGALMRVPWLGAIPNAGHDEGNWVLVSWLLYTGRPAEWRWARASGCRARGWQWGRCWQCTRGLCSGTAGLYPPGFESVHMPADNARLDAVMRAGDFVGLRRVRTLVQPNGVPLLERWAALGNYAVECWE